MEWLLRCQYYMLHIPLERNSLSAIAGRLSATNGKFKYLYWIAHVLSVQFKAVRLVNDTI